MELLPLQIGVLTMELLHLNGSNSILNTPIWNGSNSIVNTPIWRGSHSISIVKSPIRPVKWQ